ncbi:MAG: hypothetical protein R6U11_03125, partial [Bacteroidales bacterium]
GFHDEAIKDLYKAIEYTKNDSIKSFLYTNLGSYHFAIRQFKETYELSQKALRLDSTNIGALNNLAISAMNLT